MANPVNGLYRKLYTQNAINNVGKGTDWLELVTRNGSTAQHNISVSGGTKTIRYLLSGNFYDQKGIVKNSGFKRYSFRANVDQDINKYVKLGINLTASRIDNNNSQLGGDQYENSGVIRAAIQQGPHIQALSTANGKNSIEFSIKKSVLGTIKNFVNFGLVESTSGWAEVGQIPEAKTATSKFTSIPL